MGSLRLSCRIETVAAYNQVLLLFRDVDGVNGVGCEGTAGVPHIL